MELDVPIRRETVYQTLKNEFRLPNEARRIVRKLEIHYTPRHGNWLDIAEIELNVMIRQCLSQRIDNIEKFR